MNILLTITILYLAGTSTTETVGLFVDEQTCIAAGQIVSSRIIDGNGVSGISFACEKQKES